MTRDAFHVSMIRLVCLGLMLALEGVATAAEHHVADGAQFQQAARDLHPGDVVILKDGVWKNVTFEVKANGSAVAPVVIRAATLGGVVISGDSRLGVAGSHVTVEGLWFHNVFPADGDVVTFRLDSKNTASRCRLTQCAITQDQESTDGKERKWVSLYGAGNQVDHCHFSGKSSRGTLLVAWLVGDEARHLIESNYFGPRPRLGKNGGEIIRLGDSASSMQNARCRVAGNLFEQCDGEVEIISNKSCENVYEGNVFRGCQGTLTLRHGNRCKVLGNAFFGNGRTLTGGIRMIGEDHEVANNYLEGLQGEEARAAICVMNGMEHSPPHGYFQVKGAQVKGNFINRCKQSINIGYADKDVTAPLPPILCTFEDNVMYSQSRLITVMSSAAGITWVDNRAAGAGLGVTASMGTATEAEVSWEAYLKRTKGKPLNEGAVGPMWKKR